MGIFNQLMHGWNAFTSKPEVEKRTDDFRTGHVSYGRKPDVVRRRYNNDRSIMATIINRIAIDAASVDMRHVRVNDNGKFVGVISSGLNECLTVEANIDQAARHFRQDLVENLCDKGTIAVVPIDTSDDPDDTGSYDVQSIRIGEVVAWWPKDVRMSVYNDTTGEFGELTMPKRNVAIVENPLYRVMNEPNSTMQRLTRKLSLLDYVDEQSSSGKLDIIIQLPYTIKSESRRQQADQRRTELERQMSDGKYGVAYMDATERITQLNRPAENNLLAQVEFLTDQLYSQLGLTKSVFEGTASEAEMLNYHNRTIEPILAAIAEALIRSFLTKTARTQKQSIQYFRDPFKLAPVSQIAEIADKFTRNEVLSGNEVRGIIGYAPHKDPKADQLINKNLPQPEVVAPVEKEAAPIPEPTEERSDPSK